MYASLVHVMPVASKHWIVHLTVTNASSCIRGLWASCGCAHILMLHNGRRVKAINAGV